MTSPRPILLLLINLILITSARRVATLPEETGAPEESNEYVLDLNKLDGDPDNLMAQIKHLASALHTCGFSGEMQQMRLFELANRSVTCNDGSPAGYYFRQSQGSKKWLIFLEGGWHCFDRDSCHNRWLSSSRLMSSRTWLKTKTGTGILSPDPEENPIFWKSNVVYVPYCSSDVWSGTASASDSDGYAFMGALILNEVFEELLGVGLMDARQIVFAGSSAGGTGVLLNLDRITSMLEEAGSTAQVLGLIDSGWFLDQEHQTPGAECNDALYCDPALALQLGTKLWNSLAPKSCIEMYGEEQMWKCFFGFRIHETLQTPVFIFQWLYDEAQLTVGMSGPPIQIEHWNFMQKTGRDMRASLRNASAVFAPACYAHMVLTKSDWTNIQVRNVGLHKALKCWLKKNEPELPDLTREEWGPLFSYSQESINPEEFGSGWLVTTASPLTTVGADEEDEDSGGGGWWPWKRSAEEPERRGKKNKRRSGRRSSPALDREMQGDDPRAAAKRSTTRTKKKCQQRLLDHATCPHCNPHCPKMRNPFTDEDMEFLSFMRLFGLDLSALAEQMGLDERALSMVDPAVAMQVLAEAARN
ncbi:palmitoleoyl-protein carboxylesterase notum1'-like isoform X1 [Patiria miniata]|uniref:Notum n=1 Tax=Patiria miniata TaxID=46514 RepID=A0A913ZAM2_PATMI|nr:palmitoleoyl-protein carboxylesterase notum1'-like isoform X1 [Patiria miniata]XP_038048061.1 palmitoleoyl-protein carboxylesterase notum1'-like isoform X1 [Patiria miniata]